MLTSFRLSHTQTQGITFIMSLIRYPHELFNQPAGLLMFNYFYYKYCPSILNTAPQPCHTNNSPLQVELPSVRVHFMSFMHPFIFAKLWVKRSFLYRAEFQSESRSQLMQTNFFGISKLQRESDKWEAMKITSMRPNQLHRDCSGTFSCKICICGVVHSWTQMCQGCTTPTGWTLTSPLVQQSSRRS